MRGSVELDEQSENQATQHPAGRLRPGTPARGGCRRRRLPWRDRLSPRASSSRATTPTRRRAHRSRAPCSPVDTCRPRRSGQRHHARAPRARSRDPDDRIVLRAAGYRSSYIGKWHLSQSPHPTWRRTASPTGTATTDTSWAGPAPACTSTRSSRRTPPTGSAPTRNRMHDQPWFLTVAFVNPHDVMWFPIDQPGYAERFPTRSRGTRPS